MFGARHSLGSDKASLSYITGIPDISGIRDPVLLVIFKNILKRDSTTKERGLTELFEAFKNGNLSNGSRIDVYDENLQRSWILLYGKLSIDISISVAKLAHQCNGLFFQKLDDKHTALRLLKDAIGPWIFGLYDTTSAVSNAAKEALESVFNTHEKRAGLYKVFEGQLLDLIYEVIEIESASTLSDERFVSKEEAETKYQNVVHNALKALRVLIVTQDTKNEESYNRILSSKKFWKFTYSKNITVAKAALQVVDAITQAKPQWVNSYLDQIKNSLGKALANENLFATVALVLSHLPVSKDDDFFSQKDIEKWSKSITTVLGSGGKSGMAFWNSILQLFDTLPKSLSIKSTYAEEYISSLLVSAKREVVERTRVTAWNTIITVTESTGNESIAPTVVRSILEVKGKLNGVNLRPLLEYVKVEQTFLDTFKDLTVEDYPNYFSLIKNNDKLISDIFKQCDGISTVLNVVYNLSLLKVNNETLMSFIADDLYKHVNEKLWVGIIEKYFAYGPQEVIQTCFERTLSIELTEDQAVTLFHAGRKLRPTPVVTTFINDNITNYVDQLDLVVEVVASQATPEADKKNLIVNVEESFLNANIDDETFVSFYIKLHKESPRSLEKYDLPLVKTSLWKLVDENHQYTELETALSAQKHTVESLLTELDALEDFDEIDTVIYQSKLAVSNNDIKLFDLLFVDKWKEIETIAHVPYEVSTQNPLGGAVFLVESDSEGWQSKRDWYLRHSFYSGSIISEESSKFLESSETDMITVLSYLLVISDIATTFYDYTPIHDPIRLDYEHVMSLYDDLILVVRKGNFENKIIEFLEPKAQNLSAFGYYASRILLRLYGTVPPDPSTISTGKDKATMVNFAKALSQSNSRLVNQVGSYLIRADLSNNLETLVLLNLMLEKDVEFEKSEETIPVTRLAMILESIFEWTSQYDDNEALRTESVKVLIWVLQSYGDSSLPESIWESMFEVLEQNLSMMDIGPAIARITYKFFQKLLQYKDNVGNWNDDVVYGALSDSLETLQNYDTPAYNYVFQQLSNITRVITPRKLKVPFSYLGSDNLEFVTACYELFHRSIPLEQEDRSIELALGGNFEIPLELISLVLEPNKDEIDVRFLIGWELIYDHFVNASYDLRRTYIKQLRDGDHIQDLLDYIGPRLAKASSESDPDKPVSLLLHVYYLALLYTGSVVKSWFLNLKRGQVSLTVEKYTEKNVSPILIQKELAKVENWLQDNKLSDLSATVSQENKEVKASYTIDDQTMELAIELPSLYPLKDIQVKGLKRVGVKEKQWRAWILASQAIGTSQNGSVKDTLELFNKNISLHFQGVEACAICYAIIHQDMTLPNKTCSTCKNKFHVDCLYKWFKSGGTNTCPLCRSTFSFRVG